MRWAVVPAPKKPGLVPTISPKHAEDTNHTVPKYKSSMVTINLGKVTRNTPYFSLGGTFWYIKDWVNPAKNSFLIQLIWHSTLFFRSNYIFLNCFSLHLFINSPCAVLTHQKALCSHKTLSVQNPFLCLHAVFLTHGGLHCLSTHLNCLQMMPSLLLKPTSAVPVSFPCSFITLQLFERSGWTFKLSSHGSESIQY